MFCLQEGLERANRCGAGGGRRKKSVGESASPSPVFAAFLLRPPSCTARFAAFRCFHPPLFFRVFSCFSPFFGVPLFAFATALLVHAPAHPLTHVLCVMPDKATRQSGIYSPLSASNKRMPTSPPLRLTSTQVCHWEGQQRRRRQRERERQQRERWKVRIGRTSAHVRRRRRRHPGCRPCPASASPAKVRGQRGRREQQQRQR